MTIDNGYIKELQHELHRIPELGFDLPRTTALVKAELDKIGIAYTEKFGKGSIVADLNPEKAHFTIAIRADMDALPISEQSGVPYASEIPGQMHACGHDAHTAILIATVKALFEIKDEVACRVRFIFQPSEECPVSGAKMMVENGVMDGVDAVIGLHVGGCKSGEIGVCVGASMAASRPTIAMSVHIRVLVRNFVRTALSTVFTWRSVFSLCFSRAVVSPERSPRRSSSAVTPKISAIAGIR